MDIKSFFRTIIVMSMFASLQVYSQTWTKLTSGTTNDLVGVFAQSPCVAYVCGDNGTILKTTNGGASWVAETSGTTQELYSICFVNATTGYAVGNNGAAVQTTDGGTTWTPMSLNTTYNYRQIKFFNSNVGYITGGITPTGKVFKTTDGGATWTTVLTTPNGGFYSTYFTSLTVGYANEGISGLIYKTTDGGTTWNSVSSGLTYSGQLWFTSATNGLLAADVSTLSNGGIVATTNAGATWSATAGGTSPNSLSGIGFYDANNGFAVGGDVTADTATLLQTTNGGTTWSQVALPSGTPRLTNISFYNQATGYIAGLGGTILKYSPPSGIGNVSIAGNTSICAGQSTTLTASGAASYVWSTGASTAAITVNPPATTTYTVIGTGTCFTDTVLSTVTVVSTPPTVTVNSGTICSGSSILLTANGATSYTWSPATGLSSTTGSTVTADPTTPTTYTVTGSIGCLSNTATSVVTVYPQPAISVNSPTICMGSSATLTAVGANSYTWTPTTNLSAGTGVVVIATPTITSTYTVSGTNANGCSNYAISLVTVNVPFSGTLTVNSATICSGDSILLIASGGTNAYSWSPSLGLSSVSGATVTAFPSRTTTYTVTSSGTCGGNNSDTSVVTVNPSPLGNVSSSGIGCQSIQALFTGSNGTPPYSFTFQINGASQSINGKAGDTANLSIQNVALGTYTCSLISVQDSNYCSSTIINNSTVINVYQNPSALFSANPQQTDILTPKINITDASAGAVGWLWNFADSSTSVSPNPLSHSYKDSGVYTIKLVINSSVGCKDSSYQTVTITPFFAIYIPNAFTPNGDGINDIFTPKGEGILNYEMNIYDRWGNMIYYTNDMNKGWDGKANGGSQMAQTDTYVYMITLSASSNKEDYTYRGSFNLLGK